MGQELDTREYVDEQAFTKRLRAETRLVSQLYRDQRFETFDPPMLGAEVEAWLVDDNWLPAPENEAFLDKLDEPLVTHELARFNFELNLDPHSLPGGLPKLKNQIDALWADCEAAAASLSLKPLMIGMPPTLIQDMLSLDTMTPSNRYKALNERVMEKRGTPTKVDISRRETLELAQNHLMIEAACTSLQTHLTVNPGEEARIYNAAQIVSAPLVALSANSPFLYGRRLWEETRIPAFEQAIGIDSFRSRDGAKIGRVTFGAKWLRESFLELFLENLDGHDALLPIIEDAPQEKLRHFKLQNGTLWRWNRPIIGGDATGTPHLRIENRVTPAGPTAADMVANAAFFIGLTRHLAGLDSPPDMGMEFSTARGNFYASARRGLGARIQWIDGETHDIQRLIHDRLIGEARQGLVDAGVPDNEARAALEPIRGRARTGQNGAAWQRNWVNCHGRDFQGLVAAYYDNQQKGRPVHTWRI
ncbi:glutamate-cysteine ligase family protein [Hyphobacterium sp. HN65]|uniref:Glutamate-cysteine ligase family protein n=1 Tax=Hyphobacterium lacteum TaxID=3116575 RepID=A0ABU7LS76_9PROT|nr:glutamate-cysteine ligase family protein [Hyphobacterium sp. HN65]MEE2526773.1 glutamate-cysteine ligase family protein [Hyphobacterium sp. HN65]